MAEIGLVLFARTAMSVLKETVPEFRTKFSKRVFSQPQLLAILCLMRYEDWTFRETEVRLKEHRELCEALEIEKVPDYTTLYRFMRRVDETLVNKVLGATARRVTSGQDGEKSTVAVDGTGLEATSVSRFFVNRQRDRGQGLQWKAWCKWVVAVDCSRKVILSQLARPAPVNDCASLPMLVRAADKVLPVGLVLADAEFDSERNHLFCRKELGAMSIIPAKRGKKTWNIKGIRREMRESFPREGYGKRAIVETVFSIVKRKLSAKAPGRTSEAQRRQAMILGAAYNFYRL
jgi:hypothetical protein